MKVKRVLNKREWDEWREDNDRKPGGMVLVGESNPLTESMDQNEPASEDYPCLVLLIPQSMGWGIHIITRKDVQFLMG